MAKNCLTIELKTIKQICDTLEKLIIPSIGPRGTKVLLASETGQVIITSNGNTILRKLHFSHPVARLIIDSMTRTINFTEDGSKTYIFYISQILTEIVDHSGKAGGRNALVQAFQKLKQELNTNFYSFIWKKLPATSQQFSSELFCRIMKTSMSNFFPPRIVDHYISLLCSSIFYQSEHFHETMQRIDKLTDNFEDICLKIPNLPYNESKTIAPFIIQRPFSLYNTEHSTGGINFVICLFPITRHCTNSNAREIIRLQNENSIVEFIDHHQALLKRFVQMCVLNNVNLVLCSEQVSDAALELFKSSKVHVISYVSGEDCDWLINNLKISPCTNIFEKFESRMFYPASSCKPLIINGRQCVHIDIGFISDVPKMLLLCAPTTGMCDQVFNNLLKSLKSLREAIKCDNINNGTEPFMEGNIFAIGAGGVFEFLVSDFCLEFSDKNTWCDVKLVCNMLSNAVVRLPKVLFQNNSPSRRIDLKGYLHSLEEIEKGKKNGEFLGFDRNGRVSDMSTNGVLEALSVKIHILLSVIELVQQILRIDCIVGVNKLINDDP